MKKKTERGAVRAGKVFALFVSNKDKDDIIKIVEYPQKQGLLIDGATEAAKYKIKNKKVDFLNLWLWLSTYDCFSDSTYDFVLDASCASSLINVKTGKGVMRAEKGKEDEILSLLALFLIMKVLGKRVTRGGRWYNSMNHMEFSSPPSFKQYRDY